MTTTTTSELLGGQAAPRRIEHAGRVYECRPLTQRAKSEIERQLEADRRRGLLGPDPASLDPAVLDRALSIIADEVAQAKFRFGGPHHLAWVATPAGVLGTTRVLFGLAGEDEAVELILARGPEVAQVVLLAIAEALPPALADRVRRAMAEAAKAGAGEAKADGGEAGEGAADPNA